MIDHTEGWGLDRKDRRRVRRERSDQFFSFADMWNLDQAICAAVGNGLLLLAESNHGYPYREPYISDPGLWKIHLEARAYDLHQYAIDGNEESLTAAQDALRWVADNLGSLWD